MFGVRELESIVSRDHKFNYLTSANIKIKAQVEEKWKTFLNEYFTLMFFLYKHKDIFIRLSSMLSYKECEFGR